MTTVTTRIDEETQSRLDQLAKATDRSRSWLVADAIRRYVEEEGWQVAAIEEGVRQADAGDFATEDEVKAAFADWGVDVRLPILQSELASSGLAGYAGNCHLYRSGFPESRQSCRGAYLAGRPKTLFVG